MTPSQIVFSVIIGLATVCSLVMLVIFFRNWGGIILGIVAAGLFSIFLIAESDNKLYVTLRPQSMLLDKSGQVREVFAKTTELWVWDKRCSELKDGQLVSYAENYFEVKMAGPHSVTQNPKVRSIEYTVNFEIYGNPEEYLKLQKFAEKYRRTNNVSFATSQNMIAYWLYELNERRSKELAEFYNPLDNVQQDKFNQLVKDFLSEPLRDSGIRYKYAEFSIPGT